jgi:16S rRNA (cytidine1402-2'-O)-methyltransferase
MSGTLAVVATPIGNLQDITLRALQTLRDCNAVVAEDTRRTRALLSAHDIPAPPMISLPAFAEERRLPAVLDRLAAGELVALCCDGGTPAVSDPGAALVREARSAGQTVVAIPGPSAVTAAVSISGLSGPFTFLGFLPRTPGKLRRSLQAAVDLGHTVVFLESPQRLATTLRIAGEVVGERQVMIARELTKIHETMHRGIAADLAAQFQATPPRGECTVLVAP